VSDGRPGSFIGGGRNINRAVVPAFEGTLLANINGTATVPITPVPTRQLFAGFGTFSLVGTWPTGLVIDGVTGIISGTVAAPITTPGLSVRLTSSSGRTADSNTITVTIA